MALFTVVLLGGLQAVEFGRVSGPDLSWEGKWDTRLYYHEKKFLEGGVVHFQAYFNDIIEMMKAIFFTCLIISPHSLWTHCRMISAGLIIGRHYCQTSNA